MTLVVHIAALTHQGLVRSQNEDSVAVHDWLRREPMAEPQTTTRELTVPLAMVICDGMGGHHAGEVASELAASGIVAALDGSPDPERLAAALHGANQRLYEEAAARPELRGMGTTAAGLWLGPEGALWFNVGDSSVFRFANEFLMKLSVDDAPSGPKTGLLTQSLGGLAVPTSIDPHFGEAPVRPGVAYLMCSDGLTDMVPFERIEAAMHDEPAAAVAGLFEAAVEAGGADNITIVIAAIAAGAGAEEGE